MKDESEIVKLARSVSDSDHVLGQQSARVVLVEYGDYECPYCRQLQPMLKEIMKRAEGLGFVYRHFPISSLHPHALRAAEAAEAAGAQGRFWEMHDLMFEQGEPLEDARLARCARKAGLDMERYTKEMAAGAYAGRVEEDFKRALYGDGVNGTPTLYLNGARLSNIHSLEALLEAITAAGATLKEDANEQPGWRNRLRRFRTGMTRLHL